MTYLELAQKLDCLTPEQMQMDVTVSCDLSEEAVPVKFFYVIQKDDILDGVLDVGHPVLTVDF